MTDRYLEIARNAKLPQAVSVASESSILCKFYLRVVDQTISKKTITVYDQAEITDKCCADSEYTRDLNFTNKKTYMARP